MLSETVDHGHGLAIEHFGEPEARKLAKLGEANVPELTALLDARGILCDYERPARLMVALNAGARRGARRTVERPAPGTSTRSTCWTGGVAAWVSPPLYWAAYG